MLVSCILKGNTGARLIFQSEQNSMLNSLLESIIFIVNYLLVNFLFYLTIEFFNFDHILLGKLNLSKLLEKLLVSTLVYDAYCTLLEYLCISFYREILHFREYYITYTIIKQIFR